MFMEAVLRIFINVFIPERIEKIEDDRSAISYKDIDSEIQNAKYESIKLSLKSGVDPFRIF